MLECCRAERSTQFQIGAKLPFCDRHRLLFIGPSRGRSNLFRMIFLSIYRTKLLWNDIVAKKQGGGVGASTKTLTFRACRIEGSVFRSPAMQNERVPRDSVGTIVE